MAVSVEDMVQAGLVGISVDEYRLHRIHDYLHDNHDKHYLPSNASAEYRLLAKRAYSNWMPTIVKTPAQALSVSGYRSANTPEGDSAPEWDVWQKNRMDSRQHAVHYAAIAYGLSYVAVTRDMLSGDYKIRGISPRRMYASYEDPACDSLPLWALEMITVPDKHNPESYGTGHLFTQTHVIPVKAYGGASAEKELGTPVPHGITQNGKPVCPVVRFAPDIDLEGHAHGVVWPLIPIQNRINQGLFDRLVVQTFGAFKVRTIAGMAPELQRDADGEIILDAAGRPTPVPIRADASRFLMAPDADTKFGTLDETPLDGFIAADEADLKHLAAISQTPPHYLLGSIVNLSAEALAAAEAALTRAVSNYQDALGESWELVLSLTSSHPDSQAQIQWIDYESRSLAQTVDALGKAATMLKIPVRGLWGRIPGVTDQDIESWLNMDEVDDTTSRLAENAINALTPTETPPETQVTADGT